MIALTVIGTRYDNAKNLMIRAEMQADTMPDEMPTKTDGIKGIRSGAYIDTGSEVMILDKSETYVLGQDGNWYKK